MKSASVIERVDATRPPTSTCAVGANRIPLGLSRKTRPLAVSAPRMTEGSAPTTRLRRMAWADGCTMLTAWPAPTEKPSQLIAALSVVWRMVIAWPTVAIAAPPAVTWPPPGKGPPKSGPMAPTTSSKPSKPRRRAEAPLAGIRFSIRNMLPKRPPIANIILLQASDKPLATERFRAGRFGWSSSSQRGRRRARDHPRTGRANDAHPPRRKRTSQGRGRRRRRRASGRNRPTPPADAPTLPPKNRPRADVPPSAGGRPAAGA